MRDCATRGFFRVHISTTPCPRQSWRGFVRASRKQNRHDCSSLALFRPIPKSCHCPTKVRLLTDRANFFPVIKSISLTPLFCFVQRTKFVVRCPKEPSPNKIASTARRLCFLFEVKEGNKKHVFSQIESIFLASHALISAPLAGFAHFFEPQVRCAAAAAITSKFNSHNYGLFKPHLMQVLSHNSRDKIVFKVVLLFRIESFPDSAIFISS